MASLHAPRVVPLGAAVAAALALSACCGGGSSGGQGSVSTASRAVISAPDTPGGGARRGIVRSGPSFKASEITRLDNGTAIAVDQQLAGGWLRVRWPYPSGTSSGYIHQDVVTR